MVQEETANVLRHFPQAFSTDWQSAGGRAMAGAHLLGPVDIPCDAVIFPLPCVTDVVAGLFRGESLIAPCRKNPRV